MNSNNKLGFVLILFLLLGNLTAIAGGPKFKHSYNVSQANDAAQQGVLFIDVRNPDEVSTVAFDVKEIVNIPLDSLESRLAEIPRDRQVILVCRSGRRTETAYAIVTKHGLKNIGKMKGGMLAWEEAGFPVLKPLR